MRTTTLLALVACGTGTPDDTAEPTTTTTPTPTTVPAPEPTVPTGPTDTDPGGGGGGGGGGGANDGSIRVVHVAPGLPAQDMVVNGNLPPILPDLQWEEGTAYVDRAADTYTFQFVDAGGALLDAWTTFDFALLAQRRHTFVVYGPPEAPAVLPLLDDDLAIDPALVRIRWTHVAPALPSPLSLIDTLTGAVLVSDLAYGATVELEHVPDEMQVGIDTDADGLVDLTFASFDRDPAEYFHVLVTNDVDGTPFLLGQVPTGVTPRRELLP